jgi:DNA-binding transcriptional regulator GbsR (MarR family)
MYEKVIRGLLMADVLQKKESSFLEEVGLVFERTGLPRIAGRLFGWLLIADPPYQSAAELAEVLHASKGSVSTNSRLLMQIGLVERFPVPGEKHAHYRLREDALRRTVQHGLEDEITMFLKLADRGLELMRGEPSMRTAWLEQMRNRYGYLAREFPALMERFERAKPPPASPARKRPHQN